MQETITSLTETIKDLPAYLKTLVILALICAVLGYAYITKEEPASEPEPTVQKGVKVGDIQGGVQGGFNISQ